MDPSLLESVRLRYFDTLITSKAPTENNIYTINIDEAALDKYGQWPLPRTEYANIIRDLYQRNAGLVVFNVLMPEQDRQGGDSALGKTLKDYPVILGNVPSMNSKNSPRISGVSIMNPEFTDRVMQYPGIISNIPVLESNAAGVGIVSTLPEIDGVNRRIPLIVMVGGDLYPGMSIEVLRVAAGDSSFQVKLNEDGVEKMRIPKFGPIATDTLGRIWIDYSQKNKSVSLTELPNDFGGAIVIVGLTASGLTNPVPTSIGAVYPHDVQASVLGTMINGVVIQRSDYADLLEILAIAAAGLLLLFLTRYVYVGLATIMVLLIVGFVGSWYGYSLYYYLFDITAFTIGVLLVSLHAYGVKFVSEFLQKMQIKKQFGSYLSPAMVEKLQKNPELLVLGGESRELSIMFTDVRGFTTISEHYGKDVQGLTKIMNRYMTAMTGSILDNHGTLDKYIGDAQMAFWNAPLDDPNHALNSVKAALQMLERLDEFNEEIIKEGIPKFGMGIGINTAAVVVGNMGSSQRFDYTCLGDGVNLASRLEGQSKPYGVRIILGEKTSSATKDNYFILELDSIAVKGKTEGVNIFTVLVADNTAIPEYLVSREHHDVMLSCYRKQQWDTALALIDDLKGEFDCQMDNYYDMMIERIKELRESKIPSDWDGIFRATTK